VERDQGVFAGLLAVPPRYASPLAARAAANDDLNVGQMT